MEFSTLDFSKARILVIGDVMLDQFWHGHTGRISPEAPVPIVHVDKVHEAPGGAANVALNIACLGATVTVLGLVGEDAAADKLQHLMQAKNVTSVLVKVPHHPTISKLRILSRNQQLIRLDTENLFTHLAAEDLLSAYQKYLSNVDVVILADYNKGTLNHAPTLIQLARAAGIPVLVDPKRKDFSHYQGATVITPNLKEFEEVVGRCEDLDDLVLKAKNLLDENDLEALVITRAEAGLTVVQRGIEALHIAAKAQDVFDVTGAGDTVIAVMGVALAAGVPLNQAAYLGNIAGGIVVGKLGTATVTMLELKAAIQPATTVPTGVLSLQSALAAIEGCRAQGERIIFTNGCFDILHAGHVMYLQEAKNLGDRLVLGLNDDDSVRRLKGETRPINPLADRMSVLAALRAVDWVIPFSQDTPEELVRLVNPDILVKGGDYSNKDILPGAAYVLSQGGKVQLLSLKEGCSTTNMIQHIQGQSPPLHPLES